ncbi:complex I intermediate-associated protein CIA30 [Rhizoctonia solani]|uniref:Complex I intermediate-associated protein CIA30 n=1 Tax=Rhizoctonia solani TaxID=456999 RepID=A0A8H8NYG2_9AGAM|nr:complex I intermediate-associated protein CIA30 [Rhizoctonia solani]QRW21710.1 complex I intermediate-associated protein CIA30 [Rhizoctonia solani]
MSILIFPPWCFSDWETVDDRIRGGKSVSTLQERNAGDGVWFSGTLDTTALGGAGFASQRFRFSNNLLRLPRPEYQGIRVTLSPQPIALHNPRDFTLVLNTEPITYRPDGRVESRVAWEATFTDSAPSCYFAICHVSRNLSRQTR